MNQKQGRAPSASTGFASGLTSFVMAGLMMGCAAEPAFHQDERLQALLDQYAARSFAVEEELYLREQEMLSRVWVRKAKAGVVVTVDLEKAPVDRVVQRILDLAGTAFNMSSVGLSGTVTTRFYELPLADALNQLVNPSGISVKAESGILVFHHGVEVTVPAEKRAAANTTKAASKAGSVSDDGNDTTRSAAARARVVHNEVALRHLDSEEAVALLKGLFGSADADGAPVKFGAVAELNAIYIAGPPEKVAKARALLGRADREVPHVQIEALVVEFEVSDILSLGGDLSQAAVEALSGINFLPSASNVSNITFSFLEGADNPAQFTALIDLLVSVDKAQVLSRPYMTTRSQKQAKIEIVNDSFIVVEKSEDGASITSSDSISAGVILQVKPVVQSDGLIRLDLSIEESEFVESALGSEVVSRNRSTAQTAMTVRSGQTIVVGGLNRQRREARNAGTPWLRRVPGVNLLTAKQETLDDRREVVVYLTPYVWRPSMHPAVAKALPVKNRALTDFERLEGARNWDQP